MSWHFMVIFGLSIHLKYLNTRIRLINHHNDMWGASLIFSYLICSVFGFDFDFLFFGGIC